MPAVLNGSFSCACGNGGGNVPGLGTLIADIVYSLRVSVLQRERNRERTDSVNPYPCATSNSPPTFAIKVFATIGGRYAAPDRTAVTDSKSSFVTLGEFASWCTTGGTAGSVVTLYLVEHE